MSIAAARVRAQALVTPLASPLAVVEHLVCVQSQDVPSAVWGVGQRVKNATAETVLAAFDAGTILRTHVLRPTWHFIAPADARWVLSLTAPRIHQIGSYYFKQLDLTAKKLAAWDTKLADATKGTFLTREELGKVLGKNITGQRLAHIVMHAELEQALISGPRRGKQFTYANFDDRVPAATPRTTAAAVAELARRYVASHGPARVADFAWWSGLTKKVAQQGLDELPAHTVKTRTGSAVVYGSPTARALPAATVHLLPNFDELLVAFADRSDVHGRITQKLDAAILGAHFITVGGELVGGWRRSLDKQTVVVEATLLAPLSTAERGGIAKQALRLFRFLGAPVRVSYTS